MKCTKLNAFISLIALGLTAVVYMGMGLHFPNESFTLDNFDPGFNSKKGLFANFTPEKLPSCRLPKLEIWPSDLAAVREAIRKAPNKVKCQNVDWTFTQKGKFFIKDELVRKKGAISCDVAYIDFDTDFKFKFRPMKSISNASEIEANYFKVMCKAKDGSSQNNFHAGAAKIDVKNMAKVAAGPDNMHILIIFFDSVSRPQWHRVLPKSVKHFISDLGGVELTGHNVLGDGTPSELIPILTGKDLDGDGFELKDSRRSNPKGVNVDVYPFIWRPLRKRGYVSLYSEDQPFSGLWTYQRRGFLHKPMEHYMRHFYMAVEKVFRGPCIGGKSALKLSLDYLLDAFDTYSPRPLFAYLHNGALSHDSLTALKTGDDEIISFLKDLKSRGILNKTLLLLASDHGPRFSSLRRTKQGKLEYVSPYSSILLPPWFRKKYPEFQANLEHNAPLLTTAHDLRETMMQILDMKRYHRNSTRGWSLFDKIPKNRTCKISEIPMRLCSCLNWISLNTSKPIIQQAVTTAINKMNEWTRHLRSKCSRISLKSIKYGMVAAPDGLESSNYYEVSFQTTPGDAMYEVALDYIKSKKSFLIDPKNPITRINSYANMVHCLGDSEKNVVNYCVCKRNKS